MVKTNSKSVFSLILGILSIVMPFLGLILGIIGFVLSSRSMIEINKSQENGRGLAISGKVCSIVGICIQVFIILLIVLNSSLFSVYG